MSEHHHRINPLVACAISCHFLLFCILLVIFGDSIETKDTHTNSFQSNPIAVQQGPFLIANVPSSQRLLNKSPIFFPINFHVRALHTEKSNVL